MKSIILLIIITFITAPLFAKDCEEEKLIREYKPYYAQFFKIRYYSGFKIIDSKNDRYMVADKKPECTTSLPLFSSSVKKFIATSTTHLPFLEQFSLEKSLIAFQGTRYIYSPKLRTEAVRDIHYQLNPEELISLKPDLVMAYSANLSSLERLGELRKMGIPIVLNHDFEESHPLARSEWLVFSAAFFSKDAQAEKFFKTIMARYLKLKKSAQTKTKKVVLVGEIQNGQWTTCGGESDLATLIEDAGGEIWLKSQSKETQYVSLEKVYQMKPRPSLWLTQNNWHDLSEAKKDSRYKIFLGIPAYNNNALLNPYGFNDFWESSLMRPDLLLSDLITILKNGKLPKSKLVWYKEIK